MYHVREFEIALGNEIRAWRKTRNLTIPELAKLAGVGKSTVERLENATHSSGVANTWLIANALGVELSTIVRRAEEVAAHPLAGILMSGSGTLDVGGPRPIGTGAAYGADTNVLVGSAGTYLARIVHYRDGTSEVVLTDTDPINPANLPDVLVNHSDGSSTVVEFKTKSPENRMDVAFRDWHLAFESAFADAKNRILDHEGESDRKLLELETSKLKIEREIQRHIDASAIPEKIAARRGVNAGKAKRERLDAIGEESQDTGSFE